jgi:ribosomal protein L37AE/L43A
MRIEDLPPDLQARARRAMAAAANAPCDCHGDPDDPCFCPVHGYEARKERANRQTWTCHTCAETFTAWAPAERHSRATAHHRIEDNVPEETP